MEAINVREVLDGSGKYESAEVTANAISALINKSTIGCKLCRARLRNRKSLMRHNQIVHGC